ncbi:polysaccharide deacetylase family protein [Botrimarina sp.]|uniref:polysaccharide deacetylase family protein n=1 Tax=Botrimarina sp. TaxID=2795802 RepID=UPI0032EB6428
MRSLRDPALRLYSAATAPIRRRTVRRLAQRGRAPITVLFYHRVADTHANPWSMPSAVFERQVDWLQANVELISLAEARRRLAGGTNPRPAAVITFDDGYGDNCETAIPLLLRRRLPFTYFVSTEIVEQQTAFPHDLQAGVRLRPNTVAELRALARCGVEGVELGAHTRTHADLGRLADPAAVRGEVAGSIDAIEGWTGIRPRSFAFPFGQPGNLSALAASLAREAGADCVCSAYGAYNLPTAGAERDGVVHVRRVHADPEWGRFVNWMTVDPRKLHAADPVDDRALLAADPRAAAPAPSSATAAGAADG